MHNAVSLRERVDAVLAEPVKVRTTAAELVELVQRECASERGELENLLALGRDTNQLHRYAAHGASDSDLAALFGVPESAIVTTFGALLAKARASMRNEVREQLFRAGSQGNETALLWLSEHLLKESAGHAISTRAENGSGRGDRPGFRVWLERVRIRLSR